MAEGSTIVLIDALNVAHWCGQPPSLRAPLTLLAGLVANGFDTRLYFDASAPYRLHSEVEMYRELLQCSKYCLEVPSGRPADRVLLRDANRLHARILSRDKFRDHRKRFRKLIDDPARLIQGTVRGDGVFVPALNLERPLPTSAAEAYEPWRLVALCAARSPTLPEPAPHPQAAASDAAP